MKGKTHVRRALGRMGNGKVITWMDRLTFAMIFAVWLLIILLFGIVYLFTQNGDSYLLYVASGKSVAEFKDCIYFSFVTATTTGFGDIVPVGIFKSVAILEVLSGLLVLAMVTSKLVSIKQDVILEEMYELSVNDKVYKLRSSLLLFRQNIDRVISRVEEKIVWKREVNSLNSYFSSLEDVLNEINMLIKKSGRKGFVRSIDTVNIQLIINGVLSSLDKTNELLSILTQNKIPWRTETNQNNLNRCLAANDALFTNIASSKGTAKEQTDDFLRERKRSSARSGLCWPNQTEKTRPFKAIFVPPSRSHSQILLTSEQNIKMAYLDYCTRLRPSEDNEKMARSLGWSGIGMLVGEREQPFTGFGIRCMEIHPQKPSDVAKSCTRLRKNPLLAVSTRDLECARQTMETPEADLLLYEGPLNHVMAKLGADNNVSLVFDFSRLLSTTDRSRSIIITEMVSNAKLLRKFNAPFVLASGAQDKWGLRSPRDLISWGKTLGFEEKTCKKSVSDCILKENEKRLGGKWVSPGVERL
ncbi:MAG: RNase P subunit p30 family protein [Candidatus Aenigmatarchaeota archaeon]